jgi:EpsD family peptidyl-prolyl cis-trans isomerase
MDGVRAERAFDMTIGLMDVVSRRGLQALALAGVAVLAACGKAGSDNSQVVASVGHDEITETQVSHALERQANMRPDQVETASRQVVSTLVDQTIVLQNARDLKIDRDERVVQGIESARRELIVGAYLNRIADGAAKPSDKEVQDYYDQNPDLFAKRRVYAFQEVAVDAPPAQAKEIEAQLTKFKSPAEMAAWLKDKQIATHAKQTVLAAENVPLALLKRVAALSPGQGLIVTNEGAMRMLFLNGTQDAPMTVDQSRPAITAFLVSQARRQAVQKEMASLHADAKVSYFGKYADMAASAPAGAASGVPVASLGASAAQQH